MLVLSASMKTKSNGPSPSASILGNVESAAPVLISTLSPRPALATFRRATSACLGAHFERDQSAFVEAARAPARSSNSRQACRSRALSARLTCARADGSACPAAPRRRSTAVRRPRLRRASPQAPGPTRSASWQNRNRPRSTGARSSIVISSLARSLPRTHVCSGMTRFASRAMRQRPSASLRKTLIAYPDTRFGAWPGDVSSTRTWLRI